MIFSAILFVCLSRISTTKSLRNNHNPLSGERYYHLQRLLETESDIKTSLFQFLVWQGNLGVIEHPVFKHLTEAKWELYGLKPTKNTFVFLGFYSILWIGLYMLDQESVNSEADETGAEEKYVHIGHLCIYFLSIVGYLIRLKINCRILHRRHKYLMYIKILKKDMHDSEAAFIHEKGKHLIDETSKEDDKAKMTFINDIKRAPSVIIDLIVDHVLLLYFVINISSLFNSDVLRFEKIVGAIAIICLWTNNFLKLQITKKIGPFVIFMKYVPTDLWTVCTMFITLFMPAFLVFYKTIFTKRGLKVNEEDLHVHDLHEQEGDGVAGDRVRRGAAKGGNGGGQLSYEPLNVIGSFFAVLRMVLVDYEYEDGLSRSEPPLWWMIISLFWIIVSSIIILNLMIAVMADSYTRIYERSEISARVRRAQTICDIEKKMDSRELGKATQAVMSLSPIKITFDPVCDRDKMEIVSAKVQLLTKKMNKLEHTINQSLFLNLKRRLDFVETKINIQSYKPTTSAPFFRYG